ncbi:MAG: ABC transporter ATP-binding protein [Erysipelotrichaceae bacterium]|nr:ABC transporter ATP-binding protein [Erysipelotrichaceae bacterium]
MSRPKNVGTDGKKLDINVLKRLLIYILSRYKIHYIFVFICIVISSLAQVSASLFMKILIDDYITPLIFTVEKDFTPLITALMVMASIYLIGVITNFIYQKLLVIISQGTLENIRRDLFSHMQKLPISYFDTHSHGDIMSIYTNDTDTLRQVISQSIPQFLVSFFTIISVFISMIILSVPLTLITLSMVVVMQFVLKKIMSKSGRYFSKQQKMLGLENGYIEEMMEGARVVKVFNYENKAINNFNKINKDLFDASFQANKYANILMPVVGNLGHISYVLVALIGGAMAVNGWGNLTIGGLASFLTLNRSFNGPLNQISQQLNSVIMAMAGAERIFKLLDEEVEVDNGFVTLVNAKENEDGSLSEVEKVTNIWAWKHKREKGQTEYVRLRGDVRFYDVNFSYIENKPVLKGINLYAEPGEKIAFVGATGAGKTTITNLINRFYDINHGSITYDGIDIKLIKKDDLRRSLGIVLQDTNLFTGTIEENIKYARPNATFEEVIEAAKLANAHYFIKHLEHGYDTVLTRSGASLSQGQRQLLSIARAALANSPVLILDEATSSIDSQTERLVQEGMDKLMSGRTTFVIAHRLSTIKNSNVIMVLDNGEIIERGNHKSLLEKKGTYYKLYTGLIEND